ncbi:hypothetical protein TNCV_2615491 [Trichonephila clavipes]|nr:hypothetical protein TNCV_2615491 [Trichonephila clavipes]
MKNSAKPAATRRLLETDLVILNHSKVTKTTPELAQSSPNYHIIPTEGYFEIRFENALAMVISQQSLVYADKPQTLDHLEDNIRRVIADIRPQMLERVIENWTSRLDYIRASRGSPMPEIIFKM